MSYFAVATGRLLRCVQAEDAKSALRAAFLAEAKDDPDKCLSEECLGAISQTAELCQPSEENRFFHTENFLKELEIQGLFVKGEKPADDDGK